MQWQKAPKERGRRSGNFIKIFAQCTMLKQCRQQSTQCLFIAYLYRKQFEYSSIVFYVHSLSSFHVYYDIQPPQLNHFAIKQSLAVICRGRKCRPNQRQLILRDMLWLIEQNMGSVSARFRKTFWAACLVLFLTSLRKSNVYAARDKCHLETQRYYLPVREQQRDSHSYADTNSTA